MPDAIQTYPNRIEKIVSQMMRGEATAADVARVIREDAEFVSDAILARVDAARWHPPASGEASPWRGTGRT